MTAPPAPAKCPACGHYHGPEPCAESVGGKKMVCGCRVPPAPPAKEESCDSLCCVTLGGCPNVGRLEAALKAAETQVVRRYSADEVVTMLLVEEKRRKAAESELSAMERRRDLLWEKARGRDEAVKLLERAAKMGGIDIAYGDGKVWLREARAFLDKTRPP